MAFITLYSFYESGQIKIVIYDSDNPSYISHYEYPGTYDGSPPRPPDGTQVGGYYCQPGTFNRYTYKAKSTAPYAYYEVLPNSSFCGYSPPACDIMEVSFTVTDETGIGANDGTVNMFATSSYGGIVYYLSNGAPLDSNTTGYFTGLAPDEYIVDAIDSNFCVARASGVVEPFDTTKTHYKYRLEFAGIDSANDWELRLYDQRNNYDSELYPIDISGTESPVIIRMANDEEDKVTAIISKEVEINLWFTGLDFTTEEFTNAPERQWFCELYKNGVIEFRGWVLPDETQDEYADAPYVFTLKATDGLPSLKGNSWGDGSGGNGYTPSQVPQYALTKWFDMLCQCLNQLGYEYGNVIIVSSLQYDETYNANLWADIATWSDLLYDSEGIPIDTYSALETLLIGLRLQMFQYRGGFILLNWNDMYYLGNSIKFTDFLKAFYELSPTTGDVVTTGITVQQPSLQLTGYSLPVAPINPIQSLNYDKAYNIKGDVEFNILALLYNNPSFEIGAVEGELPTGFTISPANISAYSHEDATAYDGSWELRVQGALELLRSGPVDLPVLQGDTQFLFMLSDDRRVYPPAIVIDQVNKKINVSFVWRPIKYSDDENVSPTYGIFFTDGTSGNQYLYSTNTKNEYGSGWFDTNHPHAFTFIDQRIDDYVAWNNFSVSTDVFPESGLGTVNFAFTCPMRTLFFTLTEPDDGVVHTIDYDQLELTLSDANDAYSKQTGETHTLSAVTTQAEYKEVDLKLFTYPQNKRIAGNLFTDTPYIDGDVANLWNFQLKSLDTVEGLAATVSRSIARQYARNMQKFEGDVKASYLDFYAVYLLSFYESKKFMPFSLELDCRNCTGHVVLVEIDDSDIQSVYTYRGKYQKSARRNNN